MRNAVRMVVLVLSGALSVGCILPRYYPLPPFEQSHAVMIEKAIAGVPVTALVKDYIKKNEKVAVVSMENMVSRGDLRFDLMVDDNFIQNLTSAGYRVLERDETMITRIVPEQGINYKRVMLRQLPTHPSIVLMDGLEAEGLSYVDPLRLKEQVAAAAQGRTGDEITLNVDRLNLAEVTGFYKQLKDDYQALEGQLIRMDTADVMVSYRILDFGIQPDVFNRKVGEVNPVTGRERFFSCKRWVTDVHRNAMARLFVRVMDAKTGEVRIAKVLQNQIEDTIAMKQDWDECESHYLKRLGDFLKLVDYYKYEWKDQQLPDQQGAETKAGRVQTVQKRNIFGQAKATSANVTAPTSTTGSEKTNIFGRVMGPDTTPSMSNKGEYIFPNLISFNVLGGPTFGDYTYGVVMPGVMYSRALKNNWGILASVNFDAMGDAGAVIALGAVRDTSATVRSGFRLGYATGFGGPFLSFPITWRMGSFALTLDFGGIVGFSYGGVQGGPLLGLGAGLAF